MTRIKGFEKKPSPFRDEPGIGRVIQRVPKRAVNVSIQEDILAEAKAMKLNLSEILEDELRRRVRETRAAKWSEENREFIDSYNAYIERNGVFSEELLDLDDPPV